MFTSGLTKHNMDEDRKTEKLPINTVNLPEFTNVSLEGDRPAKKKKVPRRILHFSDGTLEEYSTDEEEEKTPSKPLIDPKTLSWIPWFWHYLLVSASSALGAADFCGEKLAWFFGITSPKYQHAIDEYYRLKAEDEAEMKKTEDKHDTKITTELSTINIEDKRTPESPSKIGLNKEEYDKY